MDILAKKYLSSSTHFEIKRIPFIDLLWMKKPSIEFFFIHLKIHVFPHPHLRYENGVCFWGIHHETIVIIHKFPIMLGGKSVLVDIIVMIVPMYFSLLLGNNYACSMNVVVSSLFCVMHCTRERRFETFDKLSYCDSQPFLTLDHAMPFSAHTKSNPIVFLGNTM